MKRRRPVCNEAAVKALQNVKLELTCGHDSEDRSIYYFRVCDPENNVHNVEFQELRLSSPICRVSYRWSELLYHVAHKREGGLP